MKKKLNLVIFSKILNPPRQNLNSQIILIQMIIKIMIMNIIKVQNKKTLIKKVPMLMTYNKPINLLMKWILPSSNQSVMSILSLVTQIHKMHLTNIQIKGYQKYLNPSHLQKNVVYHFQELSNIRKLVKLILMKRIVGILFVPSLSMSKLLIFRL